MEQDVEQKRRPDLPAHGVFVVAEEVGQLQGLFDLLKEDLDLPAAAVEVGHAGGGSVELVGEVVFIPLLV